MSKLLVQPRVILDLNNSNMAVFSGSAPIFFFKCRASAPLNFSQLAQEMSGASFHMWSCKQCTLPLDGILHFLQHSPGDTCFLNFCLLPSVCYCDVELPLLHLILHVAVCPLGLLINSTCKLDRVVRLL